MSTGGGAFTAAVTPTEDGAFQVSAGSWTGREAPNEREMGEDHPVVRVGRIQDEQLLCSGFQSHLKCPKKIV